MHPRMPSPTPGQARSTIRASIYARGVGACTTILLVRLDDYQALVDDHGDTVASQIESRVEFVLRGAVRGTDNISRLAPAAFSILLSDAPTTVAELVGMRLQSRLPDALADVGFPSEIALSVDIAPPETTTL